MLSFLRSQCWLIDSGWSAGDLSPDLPLPARGLQGQRPALLSLHLHHREQQPESAQGEEQWEEGVKLFCGGFCIDLIS